MDIAEWSGADEHLLKFEVEEYRRITIDDAKSGAIGGMLGVIGGVSLNAALFGNRNNGSPLTPVSQEAAQPQPALRSQTLDITSPAPVISRANGLAPRATAAQSGAMAQPEARALAGDPSTLAVEYQAGLAAGITLVLAFGAVAISSAVRYWSTRRKVNFKSSLSGEELKALYDLPAADK